MTTLVKKIHEFSPPMTNDARSANDSEANDNPRKENSRIFSTNDQ